MPSRIGPRARLAAAVAAAVGLPAIVAAVIARREVADAARGVAPTGDELLGIAGAALLTLVLVAISIEALAMRPLERGWTAAGRLAASSREAGAREQQSLSRTVMGLAAAVDARDPHTRHHSERVASYAAAAGQALGLSAERIERLRTAGLLHDVGKIAIPDSILLKPTYLSDAEFDVMKTHCAAGEHVARAAGLEEVATFIRSHHERFAGGGYPDGIAGDEIALEARILCACEAVEAMLSRRSYSAPMDVTDVCAALEMGAGSQFDPAVAAALADVVRTERVAGSEPAGQAEL